MTRALLAVVVITVAATTAAAALSAAPKRERLTFTGGDAPQSDPCEPLAPHGYFGIDATVAMPSRPSSPPRRPS